MSACDVHGDGMKVFVFLSIKANTIRPGIIDSLLIYEVYFRTMRFGDRARLGQEEMHSAF